MGGMAEFFAELKRRHIYRVGAAYAVVAWLLLQVVNNVAPGLNLPNWAVSLVIVLLAVGFPVMMLFCWVQHLPQDGAVEKTKTSRLDWILVGGLAAVIALISYQQLAPSTGARPGETSVAPASSIAQAGSISVAVLPFVNLSDDRQQEFFSDGMTEEITSALAKISNLRVVGRTSAFQFKGENKDLRAIGQALSATHLIEGSVRKDGNEVRITAQLIKADDGTHLWTESYNRELKGVFAIQEEIASAIASALRVPLGLKEGQSLVANRTTDTDSYQDYLRAKALVRGRGALEPGGPLSEAIRLLEQVVARDPNYAPAWALLGQAYVLFPNFGTAFVNGSTDEFRRLAADSLTKGEAAAQQAIRLDRAIDGYTAVAMARTYRGRFIEAEDSYNQALSLDPENPDALQQYSLMLANVGRAKDSLALRLRLHAQEPLVPIFNAILGDILWENGRADEAIAILEPLPPTLFARYFLAQAYASTGRYSEAADALQQIPQYFLPGRLDEAVRLLRSAPANAAPPPSELSKGFLGFVYRYVGAPETWLDFFEGLAEAGVPDLGSAPRVILSPAYAPVRKLDRFKALVRKIGLVEYWRAKGWPSVCRPVGADDFACS
jgi:TolB-like protein